MQFFFQIDSGDIWPHFYEEGDAFLFFKTLKLSNFSFSLSLFS